MVCIIQATHLFSNIPVGNYRDALYDFVHKMGNIAVNNGHHPAKVTMIPMTQQTEIQLTTSALSMWKQRNYTQLRYLILFDVINISGNIRPAVSRSYGAWSKLCAVRHRTSVSMFTLILYSYTVGGLSYNDFMMAFRLDCLYVQYVTHTAPVK